MASTNIIELAKNHCRLYKGGDKNPYDPTKATENEWAEEIYKLAIRDKLRKMDRPDVDFMAMYFNL